MVPARLRRIVWLVSLGALLALAACGAQGVPNPGEGGDANGGDGGGNAGSNTGPQPCTLISADEIGELAGGTVTTSDDTETSCSFTLDETELIEVRYESSYDANLETARLICDDAEDLDGVGDQAIWCPGFNVLYFNKSNRSMAVQLVFLSDEPARAHRDIAVDIARRVSEGL